MTRARTVACPHCGTPVEWRAESRWRPFCSERCKLLDLGAWANEDYRLPVAENEPGKDEPASGDDR